MSGFPELFGPSRDEVWSKLSAELGGRVTPGGWLEGSKVEVDVGPWTVTLDTFVLTNTKVTTTWTRLRAPYANPAGFRFNVSPENFLSGIGRFFGMQDLEIGAPEFDADWVVQGTDETRVRRLFSDPDLRALLRGAGSVSFKVVGDQGWFSRRHPEGIDMLELTTLGVVKDEARLKLFFALFAATLDRLVEVGDATRG